MIKMSFRFLSVFVCAAAAAGRGWRRTDRRVRSRASRAQNGNARGLPGAGCKKRYRDHSRRFQARAQCRSGAHHLCRSFDLSDRDPQLVRIATDYNSYVRPPVPPDIVTMNHAHSTHYTDSPEPEIKHVLRGWGPTPDQPARHDVTVRDVRVRNVPTNIRDWRGGTERHGNSIFIFEMAKMCIAHLGHLHHTLTQRSSMRSDASMWFSCRLTAVTRSISTA